ncbi:MULTISPECIES: VC0807 family protein [unclassified Kitasatospora]|uniref:VC0807 family protein n=1 Tax=unclassified Kitasatospora TaxID=2633591 RepID=UPI000A8B64C6|nr:MULTISPECIES: VC0807 family protein [unclassified Kitasatospora]
MSEQVPARKGGSAAVGWALTIGFNIVAPIITYNQLVEHGYSEVTAVLLSALWPVVDMAIYLAWHRRVDEFAAMSLIFLGLTALVAVVGPQSAQLLLVKESLVTGLFGVVCLVTLAAPRPLMFYFGRKFGTDGTTEGVERWNALWALPGFRKVQRNLTIGWGVGYVVEAAVRVALSYVLSTGAMVTLNSVLSYAVTAALVTWTLLYAKRARARGQAAAAAAAAAAEAGAVPAAV